MNGYQIENCVLYVCIAGSMTAIYALGGGLTTALPLALMLLVNMNHPGK